MRKLLIVGALLLMGVGMGTGVKAACPYSGQSYTQAVALYNARIQMYYKLTGNPVFLKYLR